MYLFNKILKQAASIPPWAAEHTLHENGTSIKGYWVDTNHNHKVFLRSKDGIIWLPKILRGKRVEELNPEELKAIPKDESGNANYDQWQEGQQRESIANKLHNGYSFTPIGEQAIQRLQKLVEKFELDNVGNIGILPKFSLNPELFNKLLSSNNRDDVKRLLRLIGKKFTIIIHLLNQANPKLAKRLDKDFMFGYKPLEVLSDFDPTTYEPLVPDMEPTNLKHVFEIAATDLLNDVQPMLSQNTTCVKVLAGFKKMVKLISKEEVIDEEVVHHLEILYIETMKNLVQLMNMPNNEPETANCSQIAEQVAHLPSLHHFHELVYGVDNNAPEPGFDNSL